MEIFHLSHRIAMYFVILFFDVSVFESTINMVLTKNWTVRQQTYYWHERTWFVVSLITKRAPNTKCRKRQIDFIPFACKMYEQNFIYISPIEAIGTNILLMTDLRCTVRYFFLTTNFCESLTPNFNHIVGPFEYRMLLG